MIVETRAILNGNAGASPGQIGFWVSPTATVRQRPDDVLIFSEASVGRRRSTKREAGSFSASGEAGRLALLQRKSIWRPVYTRKLASSPSFNCRAAAGLLGHSRSYHPTEVGDSSSPRFTAATEKACVALDRPQGRLAGSRSRPKQCTENDERAATSTSSTDSRQHRVAPSGILGPVFWCGTEAGTRARVWPLMPSAQCTWTRQGRRAVKSR